MVMTKSPYSNYCQGSNDGGEICHDSNLEFNERMKTLAQKLNLAGHWVHARKEKKFLYCCGDIEGHYAKDGMFYLLDTARVFPPGLFGNFSLNEKNFPPLISKDVYFIIF